MPSMLIAGVPVHSAIAATKFSNTFSSCSSFYVLLKKRKINLQKAMIIAPFAILGGVTGSLITSILSEQMMTGIAVLLLTFALLLNFLKKPKEQNETSKSMPKKVFPYLYGISIYDGMFGPGQATLLMFTYLQHGFSYLTSIALTRFQTFLSCLGAFITYLYNGYFDVKIAIFLAIGSFIGAQVSVRVASKLSNQHLQIILRSITVILIIQLSLRLL